MNKHDPIAITSSELGYLWTGFSITEMSKWFLTVFQEHAVEKDVKTVYSFALQVSEELLNQRGEILSEAGYPIPVGFSASDIDQKSAPIFTDHFLLFYLHVASQLGLAFHSKALTLATRADIRKHHIDCVNNTVQLNEQIVDLLLNKGLYWLTPTLPKPDIPEKIQKSSYLHGWFGDTRPINSIEMANLYSTLEILALIDTLCMGFAQTSSWEVITALFLKGSSAARSHYNQLGEVLKNDELPLPPTYTAEVLNSKQRVFSDHIMLCHLAGFFGSLITQYGFSIGSSMKHNLVTNYLTLIGKAGAFSEKATQVLIDHEWLEKVPGAVSREDILESKRMKS